MVYPGNLENGAEASCFLFFIMQIAQRQKSVLSSHPFAVLLRNQMGNSSSNLMDFLLISVMLPGGVCVGALFSSFFLVGFFFSFLKCF